MHTVSKRRERRDSQQNSSSPRRERQSSACGSGLMRADKTMVSFQQANEMLCLHSRWNERYEVPSLQLVLSQCRAESTTDIRGPVMRSFRFLRILLTPICGQNPLLLTPHNITLADCHNILWSFRNSYNFEVLLKFTDVLQLPHIVAIKLFSENVTE